MDMIKIDPKLFVTCRLCVEDTGMYQITPVVQSQIKYCFDIEVNSFDSLPQLICSKCETILSEYVTIKRTFVGKQNALRARSEVQKSLEAVEASSVTQQGVVSSSQSEPETSRSTKTKVDYSNAQSSESENCSRSESPPPKKKKKYSKKVGKVPKPIREQWEENYKRSFICRQCNKNCSHLGTIRNHLKTHNEIYKKYQSIFNRFCTVTLEKIDEKPNLIDSNNVVLDEEKIIADKGNMTYHVIFTPKDGGNKSVNEINETSSKMEESLDYSDDEILVKGNKKKRLRLLSNSSDSDTSNGTVCLDVKKQPPEDEEGESKPECINLDSDSEKSSIYSVREVNNTDITSLKVPIRNEVKTCKRLVTSCHGKYKKRVTQELDDNLSTNSEYNINNKILNTGRKLIKKPGANVVGVLRYVEQRNIELEWQKLLNVEMGDVDGTVRIMPKLRNKTVSDKQDWIFVDEMEDEMENNENSDDLFESEPVKTQCTVKAKKQNKPKSQKSFKQTNNNKERTDNNSENIAREPVIVSTGPTIRVYDIFKKAQEAQQSQEVASSPDSSHAILYAKEKITNDEKILLNANPVANPKQLPKKACPKSAKPTNYETMYSIHSPETSDQGVELHMPIITSTTSLAKDPQAQSLFYEVPIAQLNTAVVPEAKQTTITNASTSGSEVHLDAAPSNEIQSTEKSNHAMPEIVAPRIKVKPVSELMSQRALNNLNQRPSTPVSLSKSMPILEPATPPPVTALVMPENQFQRPNILQQSNQQSNQGVQKKGFVILDTIQFPNTKTYSPIKYVQNLLHTHNIFLSISKDTAPRNYINLIKFKVKVSADTSSKPVELWLSLHAHNNNFILGLQFQQNGSDFFDINNLSAGWQWEILSMVAGDDVVERLLQKASQNKELHDFTNTLLCLIKSIRQH